MKRIDDKDGLPVSHLTGEQAPNSRSRQAAVMMIDAIMEELAEMNVDLETISLEEMKQLFSDACRDA